MEMTRGRPGGRPRWLLREMSPSPRLQAVAAAVIALFGAVGCGSSQPEVEPPSTVTAAPPVYLLDPGLETLTVRPQYISFPIASQKWTWIRELRWQSWGGDTARGLGTLEVCADGRCRRTAAEVRLSRRRPASCPTGSSYTRISYVTGGRERTRMADPYVCEDD